MAKTPVTKLMGQDSNHFFRLALLNQGIIDNNVLLPRQAVEVGIAVSTALAAIDNIQLVEREIQLLSKSLDASLQITRLKRRELVEQREDDDRVNGDGKDLDEDGEEPQVVEERVASLLDDLQNSADDRSSQHNTQRLALDHIRNPQFERLLVESEFLLEDEGLVVRHGQGQNSADDIEPEEKQERLRDLALESGWEIPCQQQTTQAPKLGEDIAVDKCEVLELTIDTGDETEFSFCATVFLARESCQCWIRVGGFRTIPDSYQRPSATLRPQGPWEALSAAGPYTDGAIGIPRE